MAGKRVTNEDIKRFNKLYSLSHNYSAVARITGFTPGTVKKYIIPDYEVIEEASIVRFEGDLPEFNPAIFRVKYFGELCVYSEEEARKVEELKKELEL